MEPYLFYAHYHTIEDSAIIVYLDTVYCTSRAANNFFTTIAHPPFSFIAATSCPQEQLQSKQKSVYSTSLHCSSC